MARWLERVAFGAQNIDDFHRVSPVSRFKSSKFNIAQIAGYLISERH
jgi:hypothetical protein